MKRLQLGRDGNQVEDATVVREFKTTQKRRRLGLFAAAVVGCAMAWPLYVWYGKPWIDERRVEAVLVALGALNEEYRKWASAVRAMPREQMLLAVGGMTRTDPKRMLDLGTQLAGARAALDLAIREGSEEARLNLGKAFRDGVFGAKDSVAALREIERVRRNIEPGVKVGDATALYVHARMLSEGLGVALDRDAAIQLMRRAADGLSGWRLKKVATDAVRGYGVFNDRKDRALADLLANRLMDAGDQSAYDIGMLSCGHPHDPAEQLDRFERRIEEEVACKKSWIDRGVKAGNKSAMARHASLQFWDGNLDEAMKWYRAAGAERDNEEEHEFGLAQAIMAPRIEDLLRGVRTMWTAIEREKTSLYATFDASPDEVGRVQRRMRKTLMGVGRAAERRNFSIALLAQAELAGNVAEIVPEVKRTDDLWSDDMPAARKQDSLAALIDSPQSRRTASLIVEVIRGSKSVPELLAEAPLTAAPAAQSARGSGGKATPSISGGATRQPDPEQQARSGYLPGTHQAASGGLSTFAVDNTRGAGDAVVRLYLGGRKPEARTFMVKQGDKFTVKSLAQGAYVMRYRLIGSDDTYEADKQFVLTESDTEGGRRFSNVTVTLYGERDGNLSTRKVPPEQF